MEMSAEYFARAESTASYELIYRIGTFYYCRHTLETLSPNGADNIGLTFEI